MKVDTLNSMEQKVYRLLELRDLIYYNGYNGNIDDELLELISSIAEKLNVIIEK